MSHFLPILLAEDDENDIYFVQRAFKDAEIKNPLYIAHDGQEAIEILSGVGNQMDRQRDPLPCLLILDLKMPRKTGMDVLRWRREQPVIQCIPAMIFSSSAHRHDVELAYRLGASAFIVKPPSMQTRTTLAQLIKGFWLDFNCRPLASIQPMNQAERHHDEDDFSARFL